MVKIKVLEVIYGFGYGGIQAFILNYLRLIDKDKFDIDIYVFGDESSPFTEIVQGLGYNINFEPENNANRNIPKFISQLRNYMIQHGPYDVVHAHNNLISAWVLLAARLAKVPIRLSHSHTTAHFGSSIIQKYYSYLRRFIIDKLATRKIACGQLAGETMYGKSANFEIVANGIAVDRFIKKDIKRITELRKQFNIPEGVKVYANVSRLDTGKNHIFALKVFKEILIIEPDAIFLYGGVIPKISPTNKLLENKIKEYGIERNCRFTGPVMDIEQLYHLTDVWIYCSAYEGLPFGPIELQAAGIPTLVSDVVTKEIDLNLGLIHFLSLDDTPKTWAHKANQLQKKPLDSEIIKEAFRIHNFDILQNIKKLEAIYVGDI